MKVNQDATKLFTSVEEGPYSDDPRDTGNWSSGRAGVGTLIGSNRGCGAPATIAYVLRNKLPYQVTAAWMKNLPDAVYDGMFDDEYWALVNGDVLPSGLDLAAVDFGWNAGPINAAHLLQGTIGVIMDGQIGPDTLAAILDPPLNVILAKLPQDTVRLCQGVFGINQDGIAGPNTRAQAALSAENALTTVIAGFATAQLIYYRGLSNWATYGAGWSARTGRRLAAAINLATGEPVAVN
jgi:lysozyme family protein